ncbi:hypothetical protein D3C87_1519150 [compost metagenome]
MIVSHEAGNHRRKTLFLHLILAEIEFGHFDRLLTGLLAPGDLDEGGHLVLVIDGLCQRTRTIEDGAGRECLRRQHRHDGNDAALLFRAVDAILVGRSLARLVLVGQRHPAPVRQRDPGITAENVRAARKGKRGGVERARR